MQVPSLYINIDRGQESDADDSAAPAKQGDESKKDETKKDEAKTGDTKKDQKSATADRFRIIRLEAKGDKRVVGEMKSRSTEKLARTPSSCPPLRRP